MTFFVFALLLFFCSMLLRTVVIHLFWHLVISSEEMMKKFVAWDTEKRLSFAVPFTDMKPVIYLDPFLPRISELALSTSDRQTKVCCLWQLKEWIQCIWCRHFRQSQSVSLLFDAGSSLWTAPQFGGLHGWEECSDGWGEEYFATYVQATQETFSCATASGLWRRSGMFPPSRQLL